MPDIPHIDAMAISPPLTANEARVLQVLTSDSVCELSAEMIAERTGLNPERAELALGSLGARRPSLVKASPTNSVARAWLPARYSMAPEAAGLAE
jgi:hypothetical protein